MIWDELTSGELGEVERNTPVVLPVAATEQHGPHLPLATDRLIVERLGRRLSEELGEGVLVLPVVAVGCSEHHLNYPGTLSVRHETLLATLQEVLGAVARHGFTNLLILNSHGGNSAVAQVALEAFGHRNPECRVVTTSWWRVAADALAQISETGPGGVGHACEFETSLMLHFEPRMVRKELIAPGGNRPTHPWAQGDMLRGSSATLYRPFDDMTGNGVFGEPTAASPQKGAAIERAVVRELADIVRSLAEASSP